MKTLPLKLRKNGYEYTQVLRGERSCIYEQRVSESVQSYEVFLIKIKPEKKIKGKIIPAREWFPHNEAGGEWFWTFRSYDRALWRFNELEAGKTSKDFTFPNTKKKMYAI